MSRSPWGFDAGDIHERKNLEKQEKLKNLKKLCPFKESQKYYLYFGLHSVWNA